MMARAPRQKLRCKNPIVKSQAAHHIPNVNVCCSIFILIFSPREVASVAIRLPLPRFGTALDNQVETHIRHLQFLLQRRYDSKTFKPFDITRMARIAIKVRAIFSVHLV
jgi:hypothetical protein